MKKTLTTKTLTTLTLSLLALPALGVVSLNAVSTVPSDSGTRAAITRIDLNALEAEHHQGAKAQEDETYQANVRKPRKHPKRRTAPKKQPYAPMPKDATNPAPKVIATPVTPTTVPAKTALAQGPHSFILGKEAVKWNPCEPVAYKLNLKGAPSGAQADVNQALSIITQKTGLTFRFTGTTTDIPGKDAAKLNETVIAWAKPSETTFLGDNASGAAGPSFTAPSQQGPTVILGGQAVFNSEQNSLYKQGFGPGMTRGNLLLHELGHLVGLGHVHDETQLMNPYLSDDTGDGFQQGDLDGLKELSGGSCLVY